MRDVAVLFARSDSIYKKMRGCDVFDIDRNALSYRGDLPIIAHPPCRSWGSLRHFAKPRSGERRLAIWSVLHIQRNGGVLEHPAASRLWSVMNLPAPGERDRWGGFTLVVDQCWWGHRAQKRTRLYVVGCEPKDIPPVTPWIFPPTHVVSSSHNIRLGHENYRPQLRKPEREATPPAFAKWLCEVARLCHADR